MKHMAKWNMNDKDDKIVLKKTDIRKWTNLRFPQVFSTNIIITWYSRYIYMHCPNLSFLVATNNSTPKLSLTIVKFQFHSHL